MARKNIFQIMASKRDFSQEISRLESLIHDDKGIARYERTKLDFMNEPDPRYMSIEDFVDKYAFKSWSGRGTCISLKDMSTILGIEDMFTGEEYTEEEILTYAEYVANVLFLVDQVEETNDEWHKGGDVFSAAKTNLATMLGWLNYEQKVFPKKECVLVVRKMQQQQLPQKLYRKIWHFCL